MKKIITILIAIFILFSLFQGSLGENVAKGDSQPIWPMFRYNAQHTGLCPYDTSNNNGALKWNFKTGNWIYSSPTIALDGTVYIGSYDHYLYAINPNGTLKWKYQLSEAIRGSSAIGVDGTIYTGSIDGYLYALNPDGTLKWKYETAGDHISSSPAIDSDGIIYIGSGGTTVDNYIYAINPDGSLKWKNKIGGIFSSPAIGIDGTIYVGTGNAGQILYAISSDGTIKWKYTIGTSITSSPAIDSDGTIYVGSEDGYLYAVNSDSTLKWKYSTADRISSSPAIDSDGTIYVGSEDGYLYAVNPDGTLKWRYQTGSWVYSSPAIGADGTIYIGSGDGYLYAVNSDGTLKWKFNTPNYWVQSSPAIDSDGTIYVGSGNGYLYAIGGVTFTIKVSVEGIGGTITPSGAVVVNSGANQTFTITPNTGYHIKDVKVDGSSVGAMTSYTFNNVTTDHTITTSFSIDTNTITASAGLGGTISPSGTVTVNSGGSKTFTITAYSGYKLLDVKVDGISIGAVSTYTFTNITKDHMIEAAFEQINENSKENLIIILKIGSKTVNVNGENISLDVPATIIENRTYVPLRFIAETLNFQVDWSASDRKITVRKGSDYIILWIGRSSTIVNGKFVPIDSTNSKVVPLIMKGRTLVPVRFISEGFGMNVNYNAKEKLVAISTSPFVFSDNAVSYSEKNVKYNGKTYNFKIVRVDPKAKGINFVPSLSRNGINTDAPYDTFLFPNTLVMVNGTPFDTETFAPIGSIFGNGNGLIKTEISETIGVDQNGNPFYEEGQIKVIANVTMNDGESKSFKTYSINFTTYGCFTIYTNWYKENINIGENEIFVVVDKGTVVKKFSNTTIAPSEVLRDGQLGMHAYYSSDAPWIKDIVEVFKGAKFVNIQISINERDITRAFFVQTSPVIIKDGIPFRGADRYPKSYRMTKYGARVFIGTDGRYIYFIVTPSPMSLRDDPAGEIISKLGNFNYVVSLDGGGSTTFYYKGKYIYTPGRNLTICIAAVSGNP